MNLLKLTQLHMVEGNYLKSLMDQFFHNLAIKWGWYQLQHNNQVPQP